MKRKTRRVSVINKVEEELPIKAIKGYSYKIIKELILMRMM